MDKKTFYVAVGSGDIFENKTDAPYEFEIEATEQELSELRGLFDAQQTADWGTFVRSHVPIMLYSILDQGNEQYDSYMTEIYSKIYELGSPATKYEIERLGLLP